MCIFYVSFLREHKITVKKNTCILIRHFSMPYHLLKFLLTTTILNNQIFFIHMYKNVFDE